MSISKLGEMMRKKRIILIFICLLLSVSLLSGCYVYRPKLTNLKPEEVIFEFNRILNRIDEPEFFKGIVFVTTGEAYTEADKLVEFVLLKDTERMEGIREEIDLLMEYFRNLQIIIVKHIEEDEQKAVFKVSYYDNSTKISELKVITLKKTKRVWKISSIETP